MASNTNGKIHTSNDNTEKVRKFCCILQLNSRYYLNHVKYNTNYKHYNQTLIQNTHFKSEKHNTCYKCYLERGLNLCKFILKNTPLVHPTKPPKNMKQNPLNYIYL